MNRFVCEVTPCTLPAGVRLVLGSASPRRAELCQKAGLSFTVTVADCDERYDSTLTPARGVELLSVRKARAVEARLLAEGTEPSQMPWILASDTLVEIDGVPLGKPHDEEDACRMLRLLSGRRHFVRTGVALLAAGKIHSSVDSTAVVFRPLTDEEIRAYVATGEPMDKAGAYAIQGIGGQLIEGIYGAFDTVMGLPTAKVQELVRTAGADRGSVCE